MKQKLRISAVIAITSAACVLATLLGPTPTASAWTNHQVNVFVGCVLNPQYTLKYNTSNSCIRALQIVLINGYGARMAADSVYGPITSRVVRYVINTFIGGSWDSVTVEPRLMRAIAFQCTLNGGPGRTWCRGLFI
jgi:hypothetical protein